MSDLHEMEMNGQVRDETNEYSDIAVSDEEVND